MQIPDIDSDRMFLHVHGKGNRDRYVPMPIRTLELLRQLWKTHRHVHYLIPGGGLAHDGAWRTARYNYLLPEKPLSQIFRAKFRDLLKKAGLFHQVSPDIWQKDWVVDIIAVGSGEAALKYLAPYVFRVAISNRNILTLKDGRVTFRYRNAKTKTMDTATVSAEQLIRRFLHHVLPRNFQKCGLTACCILNSGIPLHMSKNSYTAKILKMLNPPLFQHGTCQIIITPFSALPAPVSAQD